MQNVFEFTRGTIRGEYCFAEGGDTALQRHFELIILIALCVDAKKEQKRSTMVGACAKTYRVYKKTDIAMSCGGLPRGTQHPDT